MIDIQDEDEGRISNLSRNNTSSLPNIEYTLDPSLYSTLDQTEGQQRVQQFRERRRPEKIPLPEPFKGDIHPYKQDSFP